MAPRLKHLVLTAAIYSTSALANGATMHEHGITEHPICCEHIHLPDHTLHPIGGPTPIDPIIGWRIEHFPRVIGWGDGVEHPRHRVPNKWPCDGHVCYNYDPLP